MTPVNISPAVEAGARAMYEVWQREVPELYPEWDRCGPGGHDHIIRAFAVGLASWAAAVENHPQAYIARHKVSGEFGRASFDDELRATIRSAPPATRCDGRRSMSNPELDKAAQAIFAVQFPGLLWGDQAEVCKDQYRAAARACCESALPVNKELSEALWQATADKGADQVFAAGIRHITNTGEG